MVACAPDDVPEEYHFWCGMVALGLTLGRQTVLQDRKPVYGNLFICTVGPSGSGKSQSTYHLDDLLRQALPWKAEDPYTTGVKRVSTPSSGEAIIHSFIREIKDINTMAKQNWPVKGLVEFSELADLVGKQQRAGNTLQPRLIDFYDTRREVSTNAVTSGDRTAIDPFCSVISTTQLKSIKRLLTQQDAASGFLNRWVFSMGPLKQRSAIGGIRIDVTPAVMPLQSVLGWASTVPEIGWSPEGFDLFTRFWQNTIDPARSADENDMLTRIDLLCKKLCLLFAANSYETVVSEATVRRVIDLFPYLIRTYNAIDERVGVTEEHEIAEDIIRAVGLFVDKHKRDPSIRDIGRLLKTKKYSNEDLVDAMKWLVKIETMQEIAPQVGNMGRPTVRYRYAG